MDNSLLDPSVKVVQCTRHPDADPESLFPREAIMFIVVRVVEFSEEVSVDYELSLDILAFINTISNERDKVGVA